MFYALSKVIPVPMRSKFGLVEADETVTLYRARWVQWRGRVYLNRLEAVS